LNLSLEPCIQTQLSYAESCAGSGAFDSVRPSALSLRKAAFSAALVPFCLMLSVIQTRRGRIHHKKVVVLIATLIILLEKVIIQIHYAGSFALNSGKIP
jgi:hypothetical protein